MAMTPRFPVPSASLLRFLRIQSDNLCYFNSSYNFAHQEFATASSRQVLRGSTKQPRVLGGGSRKTTTCLQSGIFNMDLLKSPASKTTKRLREKRDVFFSSSTTLGARHASTDQPPCSPEKQQAQAEQRTWQERLWGTGARKGSKPLRPDDLPYHSDDADTSIFTSRRMQAAKAALEPRLRCTEVDEHGKVILVDGEFKKSELIAKYGMLPRDLRKIDSSNLPHILVRPTAILLNLLHLKVLIRHDRVLLFDIYGSKTSYPQSAFMYDLQGKLQQTSTASNGGLPYEFRALEAVLTSVTSELEKDFETVRDPVLRILSELEDDIDRHKLRVLLVLSKRVSTFEQKAKLVRDAIDELLEADDDLVAMYLTEKTHDLFRGLDDHTEVEMLLESYYKLCDEVVQEAGNLVSSIRNTEEIIRAILDANRNSLMLLDLKFSVGTLGLAMGTFLAGLYGMNLENFIEETNWGFAAVTGISTICSIWVCVYGLKKLRKVQRVSMAGDDRRGVERGYHWFHDEGAVGLLDPRNREKLRRLNMMKAQPPAKKTWWKI